MKMSYKDYIQHWNYFCSLSYKLKETEQYVYHGIETVGKRNKLVNGNVYSDVFKQLILLASAEFEIIGKYLCDYDNSKKHNILDISKTILTKYPRIIETEVITLYWTYCPLTNWSIGREKEEVLGIDWWDAYNAIKHDNEDSFSKATLKNAVEALSSLYVLHLYLMYVTLDSLISADKYPPAYFKSKYLPENVFAAEGKLPDFGNKSTVEAYKESIDALF